MSRAFLTVGFLAAAACSGETLASAPEQPAATPASRRRPRSPTMSWPASATTAIRNAFAGGATTVFDITG